MLMAISRRKFIRNSGMALGSVAASEYKFSPIFYSTDENARTLGTLRELDKPGLVVKKNMNWNSVWCSAPLLNADLVRNIANEAGVHVYSEGHDLIYANEKYLSVTYAKEGTTSIKLPGKKRVTDALTGEVVASDTESLSYDSKLFETRIFKLD
jgi:hypothetical protein